MGDGPRSQIHPTALVLLVGVGGGLLGFASSAVLSRSGAPTIQTTRIEAELSQIRSDRNRLASELTQLRAATGDLQRVQAQLTSAQDEIKRLERFRADVLRAADQARSALEVAQQQRAGRSATR